MLTLKDYVNWGITHCDKTASAEGVPLFMEKCVKNKRMKQLEVYGNSIQDGTPSPEVPVEVESVGELVTDVNDTNYGKYKIPVTVRGKNIFNCKDSKSLYNGYVSAQSIETTDSGISWTCQDGGTSTVHMDMGMLSQYVGKQLTLSFDIELVNGENIGSTRFVVCTEKGQERTAVNGSISTKNGRYFITSTIPNRNENDHLTLRLYISYVKPNATYTFKNVMVSVMPGDVGFEPYVEPITTNIYLNEPLRKIGDYADVIDFKGKKVVRKIYENVIVDFDTTKYAISSFTPSEGLYCIRLIYKSEMLQKYKMPSTYVKGNSICNIYPVVYTSQRADKTLSGGSSNCATFDFIDSNYNNKTEWENHLQELNSNGTPLKITHVLATPYEEPITCELPTLPAKTSIVEIDTTVLPSNMKGEYIKK